MTNINWDEMPEWADSYCAINRFNTFWMNDDQYQYTYVDDEIYKFSGDNAHKLPSTVGKRIYSPMPLTKTTYDKWIESCTDIIRGTNVMLPGMHQKEIAEALHCALQSGELPIPEVKK